MSAAGGPTEESAAGGLHLFTYGTLMFPQVWDRIAGRSFPSLPALLSGYAAYRVQGDVYPVMVAAAPKSCVHGLVYLGIDAETLARIDAYEADDYAREKVTAVSCAAGGAPIWQGEVSCEAYVLPASRRGLATSEVWDADRFASQRLEEYLQRLR